MELEGYWSRESHSTGNITLLELMISNDNATPNPKNLTTPQSQQFWETIFSGYIQSDITIIYGNKSIGLFILKSYPCQFNSKANWVREITGTIKSGLQTARQLLDGSKEDRKLFSVI